MKVCIPVTGDGQVEHGWGRADRVAVAEVDGDSVTSWLEHDVRWDVLHDEGTEGAHHARVARFLREHGIEAVVAARIGDGQRRMLATMGVQVVLGAAGNARTAVLAAAGPEKQPGDGKPGDGK